MVLLVEYRIPLPCSVAEYKIGQMYMIAKHCHQQSEAAEGVKVMVNDTYECQQLGPGRYCEKRLYIGNRMASWINKLLPGDGLFVLETSRNHYPYTRTEYTCSLLSKLNISVDTKYVDGLQAVDNIFNLTPEELESRKLVHVDIALDQLDTKKYREDEDVTLVKSRTGRLPLSAGWQQRSQPAMVSYKLVRAQFPVLGLQTKVEAYLQQFTHQLLIHSHRQAAAWMDEWLGLTEEEARNYEKKMMEATNEKVDGNGQQQQQLQH